MRPFWAMDGDVPDRVLLLDETGKAWSVALVEQGQSQVLKALPRARQCVVIKAGNCPAFIVSYTACLSHGHVAALVPADMDESAVGAIVEQYSCSYILDCSKGDVPVITKTGRAAPSLHPDLALLLLTSGSTGKGKVVKLSRKNLQSNAEAICQFLPISAEDTAITMLPPYYSYGLSVINTHLLRMARLVLTDAGLTSKLFWDLFKRYEINSLAAVPYGYQILRSMRFERQSLPYLKYLTQAGGKLHISEQEYLKAIAQEKNVPVYVMYGQTEATARMAWLPPEDFIKYSGYIGHPLPGGVFQIQDDSNGNEVADGQEGHLYFKGPNVMMGYADIASDLKMASALDWLPTGDLAVREKGLYRITGRLSRYIKIAGTRIGLDTVEAVFAEQQKVVYACGEDNILLLAVNDANMDLVALRRQAAENLRINPAFIKATYIAELPLNTSGKPDYMTLMESLKNGPG